ncbi:hypothetical protein G3O08_01910 [Cryomorpha ignava]|uniref:DUF3375 domain-containing protein n=1 Tax=Cryomorpha ignava TaxID=101383 RepID=A0A7K3WKU8_9FLAO|nr:hypothetical protein [Cryomorpha ignava]NEN22259.1 hypothetical protein [Cryomorpha ignava]
MQAFRTLKDFIRALANNEAFFSALFARRNVSIRYEDAMDLLDGRPDRLAFLIEHGLVQQNGEFLELDEQFQEFFEQILEVNIEVSTAYIQESVESIQSNITYFLNENSSSRKHQYLRKVKSDLRKLYKNIWRNTLDLRRNIEDTYKTEPNYKIKIAKLERYDQKAGDIEKLIAVVEDLCFEKEKLFFIRATDEELNRIKWQLRSTFSDTRHQLIEIQRQIINYLNLVRQQSLLVERLRKVKFLKDQFELKEKSNITQVLDRRHDLIFEKRPTYPLKLSIRELQTDSAREIIAAVLANKKQKAQLKRQVADAFTAGELEAEKDESAFVNIDEVKNSFLASGRELLDFLLQYPLPGNMDFDARLTLYCRLVALFPNEIDVSENYALKNGVEYAMAYPA